MFKSAKRRSEKNKIKAVFKLQFQATQVPQLKATTLTISLVPADVGKPTVRLEKAAIADGTCFWENPVYETVKITREQKTGKFNEKSYHFIVSSGSSKAGLLGEASINFADYAEAVKPSTVSLPLRTSNYGGNGAILHVTINNMQNSVDQRESDAGETPTGKSQDRSLKNQLRNHDRNANVNLNFTEDECINKLASDIAAQTGSFKNLLAEDPTFHQDDNTLGQDSMPQKSTFEAFPKNGYMHQRSNTDWSVGSASDGSNVDTPISPVENLPIDRLPEASDRSIEKLVRKLSMLERQAELSELELQSLRKHIVKESKMGQDQSRQIRSLKEERDALKIECKQLKCSIKGGDDEKVLHQLQMEMENLKVVSEEIRQELNYEKDFNTALRLQLQKTENSNSELIHALKDLDEILEQKDREIADLSTIIKADKNDKAGLKEVSNCNDEGKEVNILKQKISKLYGELEVCRKDREGLEIDTEQLAMDNEILKQENHEISVKLEQHEEEETKMRNECSEYTKSIKGFELQIERLEEKIKEQALELLDSSDTINELEAQVKGLEKELDKQAQGFEDDLEGITLAKIEQEERATRAEEALRKMRSTNAIASEKMEEFKKLSAEMSSKLEENEKLAMKAVTEADGLRLEKRVLEEMLHESDEKLSLIKEKYEVKLQELSNETELKSNEIEQMSQELTEKCTQIEKMEQMKASLAEQEKLKTWNIEREGLKREFALARREAQKIQEEANTLRSLKDEKETLVRILQSDIEKLRFQYNELKHCLVEVELENENLRKEVFKFEGDIQKKEEATRIVEKKLQSNSEQGRNGVGAVPIKSGVKTFQEKGLNKSSLPASDDCYHSHLLSEMALLKESNKSMEGELKEMQERYSEISLKFAEVEGERQKLVMTVRNLKSSKKN